MPDLRTNVDGDALVGYAVRMAREYRGLSINELATRLGWHRNTLSAIEKGERSAKPVELHGIAGVLRWPVSWLESPLLPDLDDGPDDSGGTTGTASARYLTGHDSLQLAEVAA